MGLTRFRALPETDRRLALALHVYEATLCPDCGNPAHDAMDPAKAKLWRVPPPARCQACTAIARKVEEYEKVSHPQALRFWAELPDASGSE